MAWCLTARGVPLLGVRRIDDRKPVTIRFAVAIGDILVSAPPPQKEPRLSFKFYI
jgi:hypothetical protein